MTRLWSLAALMVLVTFGQVTAQEYGWTVSASSTSALANTTSATAGTTTYYLWLACSVGVPNTCSAELGLYYDGPTPLAVIAVNGWLNAGTLTSLLLAVSSHPTGPSLVAQLIVDSAPGTISFGPSDFGNLIGVYCTPLPSAWPIEWIGLGIDQPAPVGGTFCEPNPVSVQAASWGRVKSLYR